MLNVAIEKVEDTTSRATSRLGRNCQGDLEAGEIQKILSTGQGVEAHLGRGRSASRSS